MDLGLHGARIRRTAGEQGSCRTRDDRARVRTVAVPGACAGVRLAGIADPGRRSQDRGAAGAAARGCGVAPPGRYSPVVVARPGGVVGVDSGAATPVVGASDRHARDPVDLAPSAGAAALDLPEPAGTA